MIISRTPLRISLAGGGSDIPEYYKKNKFGKVISIGINRYLYVIVKKQINITDFKYKIRWSEYEQCNSVNEIKHPIIRETLKKYDNKIELIIIKGYALANPNITSYDIIINYLKIL